VERAISAQEISIPRKMVSNLDEISCTGAFDKRSNFLIGESAYLAAKLEPVRYKFE